MDVIKKLKEYQETVNPHLEDFFQQKIKKAKKIDPLSEESVSMIKDFTMSGGKRIRPALMYYGYLAAGGTKKENIINASMSIELAHSFLLIHDDIIDKDEFRHGVQTVHERYKDIAKKYFPNTDSNHFGNSMSMITGDLAASMSSEILFNSDFPPKIIIRALDRLQQIVYETIPGEMIDIVLEAKGHATEEDVMRMYEGKTARYTFEGPLHLGTVLAGNSEKLLEGFTKYSIPLGSAFQIRDDILGVFGQEKKLGKPIGSDIIEGKQTILVVKAIEKGTNKQKQILKETLGKNNCTLQDIENFKKVIIDTGSLEYAQVLSEKLVKQSLIALKSMKMKNDESMEFLRGIAEFIIKRQH